MPNLKDLKTRIASVKSTRKITSAMKMVAASKLRRAQELAESSRVYSESLGFILSSLAGGSKDNSDLPEILVGRQNPKVALLVINSSDRGLCGGFNSSLFRSAVNWIKEKIATNQNVIKNDKSSFKLSIETTKSLQSSIDKKFQIKYLD